VDQEPSRADRLDSWKEIAVYLKRDVRTVQRWEKTEGLPVKRHQHSRGGSVYAFKSELDRWWANGRQRLEAAPETSEPPGVAPAQDPRSRPALAALAVLLSIAGGIAWWRWRPVLPESMPPGTAPVPRVLAAGTSEGTRMKLIPVGGRPVRVAISPDGEELYVSSQESGVVSVIRTATETVTHSLRVGVSPSSIAIPAAGDRILVAQNGGDITVIARGDKSLRRVPTGGAVYDIAVAPDGKTAYLAMLRSGLKKLIVETGEILKLASGPCPAYLAIHAQANRLYVNYQCGEGGGKAGHDAIDVIGLAADNVLRTLSGPPNVGGPVAVSPDGSQLWANGLDACSNPAYDHAGCPQVPGSALTVYRTMDHTPLTVVGGQAARNGPIAFSPDGALAVVAGERLEIIETSGFAALEQLHTPAGGAVFSPDGRRVYVALPAENAVAVVDVRREPQEASLLSAWRADGVASDARRNSHGHSVGRVQYAAGRVGQAFSLPGDGSHVFVDTNFINGLYQDEFTITAWVKPRAVSREAAVADNSTPDAKFGGWKLFLRADRHFAFCLTGVASSECDPGMPPAVARSKAEAEVWYHLAAIFSPDAAALYVNGSLEARAAAATRRHNLKGSGLRIGAGSRPGGSWTGLIDEVEFYNRALGESEIRGRAQAAVN
jgi:YVTN family beta-propeller protein